ncbi:MAG: Asp-tRNA(Asn)/Glu-tRNA(Gln) amidotransferase GatCAB subunit B, partial [Massilioclostridium sp.]|nr:Asp-tRNA(Asn)/Glu-tRNA(Gln) amidotransferase GatCAB subunit B [Massilioclostridium sp.]
SRVVNETGKSIFETKLDPKRLSDLIFEIQKSTISNSAGKTVFEELLVSDKPVAEIIQEKGLAQISDTSALQAIVDEILGKNQKSVDDYRGGKTNALGFLVGQCMKATKGKGNPGLIKEMILSYLNSEQ